MPMYMYNDKGNKYILIGNWCNLYSNITYGIDIVRKRKSNNIYTVYCLKYVYSLYR